MFTKYRDILLIAGVSIALFVIFKPRKKTVKNAIPDIADETNLNNKRNAEIALTAYHDALTEGATPQVLADLHTSIQKKYKLRIVTQAGKLLATTLTGTPILELA
jgi:hypothetical protein